MRRESIAHFMFDAMAFRDQISDKSLPSFTEFKGELNGAHTVVPVAGPKVKESDMFLSRW